MDYLFLVYGLAFFLLAIIALSLRETRVSSLLPWEWLIVFGFLHAVHEWVHMLLFGLGSSVALNYLRIFFLAASYLALLIFGMKAVPRPASPGFMGLTITGLVLLVLSGAGGGPQNLIASTRYFLGLPGSLWAAWAFHIAGRSSSRDDKKYLAAVALLMACYAVVAGGVVPKAGILLASHINNDWFRSLAGFPIQVLRGGVGFGMVFILWRFYYHVMRQVLPLLSQSDRHWRYGYTFLLVAVLAVGWLLTDQLGRREEKENRREFLEMAMAASASLDPSLHEQLQGVAADEFNPAYQILRDQLIRINAASRVRWLYTMVLRDDRIVFVVDSAPEGALGHEPPGAVYDDAPPGLLEVLRTGEGRTVGPYTDKYGSFMSSFCAVKEPQQGKVVAVLGLDIDQRDWKEHLDSKRLPGLMATLLVVFLLTYMFINQQQSLKWNLLIAASERRYRTLIDGSPNGVLLLDAGGWIQSINSSGIKAFGHSPEELKRRPLFDAMPERYREQMKGAFDQALKGAKIFLEVEYPRQLDGQTLYWNITFNPIREKDGAVLQVVGVIDDVTGRNQAERALRESERKLSDIIDFLPDPTLAIDRAGVVIAWNKAMEKMTGVLKAEIVGQGHHAYGVPFYGYPRPILVDAVLHGVDDLKDRYFFIRGSGSALTAEVFSSHINSGQGAYLWVTASGLYDDAGTLIGAIECIRDVSANKKTEEDLKNAQLDLEARVAKRTAELAMTNVYLVNEISERVKTERDLSESERKYRELVDSLPQIVFETDMTGRITFINQAAYAVSGYTMEDVKKGLGMYDVFSAQDHARMKENFELFMHGGQVRGEEYTLMTKDGGRLPVVAYSRAIYKKKRPVGLAGFLVDITAHKQAEEVLRKAQAELEVRVAARTAELAATNESLKTLLGKQEVNIQLAHEVLSLINTTVPRHTRLGHQHDLFISALYLPCHLEGGDHFFAQNIPGSGRRGARTVISLKDQSGHEVGCILRSIVTDLLHHALLQPSRNLDMPDVIRELNRQIRQAKVFKEDDFFTAMNLELVHSTLQLNILSSGHPPFLFIREGRVIRLPLEKEPGSNPPMGWIDLADASMGELKLRGRDRLILYTDGFLDIPRKRELPAMSSADLCRLTQAILDEQPHAVVSDIVDELFRRMAGSPLGLRDKFTYDDDVAVLGMEIEEPGDTMEDVLRPEDADHLSRLILDLFHRIREEWMARGFEKPDMRLRMALEEALVNAWHHGNQECPDKRIVVRRQYGNDARLDVVDEGSGFDFKTLYDPRHHENRDKPAGRGLFVIRLFTEEVVWYKNGQHVAMYFARRARSEGQDRNDLKKWISLW
ncbi:MAG: PAS domain S-box protein [Lentisphaerota bacterium]